LNREQLIQSISSEDELSNEQNFSRFLEEDLSDYDLPQKTYWCFLEDAKHKRDGLSVSRVINNPGFRPEPADLISLYYSQGIGDVDMAAILRRVDINLPEEFLSQIFEFHIDYPFDGGSTDADEEYSHLLFIQAICERPDFFPTRERIKQIETVAKFASWIQDVIDERRGAWDAHLLKQSFPSTPSKRRTL
jgi:hypothetical protein